MHSISLRFLCPGTQPTKWSLNDSKIYCRSSAFSGKLACYHTDCAGASRNALLIDSAMAFSASLSSSAPDANNSGSAARNQSAPAPARPTAAAPVYEVFAIRYASIPDFPVNALIAGADPQRKLSIAMTVWLIRGNGRNILVDSGFYRPQFFKAIHGRWFHQAFRSCWPARNHARRPARAHAG